MTKRIYSLNMIAYVMAETGLEPDLEMEYTNGNGLVYATFPKCDVVLTAMKEYKSNSTLHNFLQAYKDLRE